MQRTRYIYIYIFEICRMMLKYVFFQHLFLCESHFIFKCAISVLSQLRNYSMCHVCICLFHMCPFGSCLFQTCLYVGMCYGGIHYVCDMQYVKCLKVAMHKFHIGQHFYLIEVYLGLFFVYFIQIYIYDNNNPCDISLCHKLMYKDKISVCYTGTKNMRFTSKTLTPKHVVTPQDLLVSPIGGISGQSLNIVICQYYCNLTVYFNFVM